MGYWWGSRLFTKFHRRCNQCFIQLEFIRHWKYWYIKRRICNSNLRFPGRQWCHHRNNQTGQTGNATDRRPFSPSRNPDHQFKQAERLECGRIQAFRRDSRSSIHWNCRIRLQHPTFFQWIQIQSIKHKPMGWQYAGIASRCFYGRRYRLVGRNDPKRPDHTMWHFRARWYAELELLYFFRVQWSKRCCKGRTQ